MPKMSLISFSCAILIAAAFGFGMFFAGYQDIHYAPAITALMLVGIISVFAALKNGFEIPRKLPAILLFIFWLFVSLSLSWSSVPFASMVTYMVFSALPLCFFALSIAPFRAAILPVLLGLGIAALSVWGLWAIAQITILSGIYGTRAAHPLQNPNNLAALFNLGLFPAIALYVSGKFSKNIFHPALLIAVFIMFAGMIATESRAALLAFIISIAVLIFICKKNETFCWKRLGILACGMLVIFTGMAIVGDFRFASRMFDLRAPTADGAALSRIAIWQGAMELFRQNPLFGTGLGTFYLYYPSVRLPLIDNSSGSWAHNDALQFAVEMGIAAPVLFYSFCAAFLWMAAKTFSRIQNPFLFAGLFCALLTLFLHSHVSFPLYILPILIVTGVWLAYVYFLSAQTFEDDVYYEAQSLRPYQKFAFGFVTLALSSMMILMAASSAYGQYHLIKAREHLHAGQPSQFVTLIAKAERFAPASFIDSEVNLAALYTDLLGPNSGALFSGEEMSGMEMQAIVLLDNAEAMNPAWGEINYRRALLIQKIRPDAHIEIEKEFETAITKTRSHIRARLDMAEYYLSRGQAVNAHKVLQDGIGYPAPLELRMRMEKMLSDLAPLAAIQGNFKSGSTMGELKE